MATDIQQQAPREQTITQYVTAALNSPAVRDQIAVGFAPWLDLDQFLGQCAIAASDPALMSGAPDYTRPDPQSLLRALLKLGQYGLIPGPARHASLIVDKRGGVQVRPEFRGWQYVWAVAGWEVSAHLVHKEDTLEVESIGPDEFWVTKHSYDPLADRPISDKTLRGGYVRGVNAQTGETRFRFVTLAKILSNRSKAQTQAVWGAHFAEMAQKTLVHVAASRSWFPTPAHVALALHGMADEDHEAAGVALGKPQVQPKGERVATRIAAMAAPTRLPPQDARNDAQTPSDGPAAETPASAPADGLAVDSCDADGVVVEGGLL